LEGDPEQKRPGPISVLLLRVWLRDLANEPLEEEELGSYHLERARESMDPLLQLDLVLALDGEGRPF
jgi:hypothetical protein